MEAIEVQNLKCGGCAASITKKLQELPDVDLVEVDLATANVNVHLSNEGTITAVREKLIAMGYPPADEENGFGSKAKSFFSCATGKINA